MNHPASISFLVRILNSNPMVDEVPIQEIKLINLTNWGWLLLLTIVILVAWLLIVFQTRSTGSPEIGHVSESDANNAHMNHDGGDVALEIAEPSDYW